MPASKGQVKAGKLVCFTPCQRSGLWVLSASTGIWDLRWPQSLSITMAPAHFCAILAISELERYPRLMLLFMNSDKQHH